MTLFGNRVFTEVNKLMRGHWVIGHWCPYQKGKFGHRSTEREDNVKRQRKWPSKAKEKDLEQILPSQSWREPNLTLDFCPPELCLSCPVCGALLRQLYKTNVHYLLNFPPCQPSLPPCSPPMGVVLTHLHTENLAPYLAYHGYSVNACK